MLTKPEIEPIDYLLIGHIAKDVTPQGPRLGGTASFSALTARSLGLRVGVVTSIGPDIDLEPMMGIPIAAYPTDESTTFENIKTPQGRIQYLFHRAPTLDYHMVPEPWRSASIVHFGPIAQEVEPNLLRFFHDSFVGITPQGWLREWDREGKIRPGEWPEARFVLEQASATVISLEDVNLDESRIEEMVTSSRVLVVTEGAAGCRLYWNGDLRRFRPPVVEEVDATGAGDIFAAAFFVRLYETRDPWEAARFANQIASISVTRPGLLGVPTPEEVQASLIQVL